MRVALYRVTASREEVGLPMLTRRTATLPIALLLLLARPAGALDVDHCGVSVPPHATAILTADLDCRFTCADEPTRGCDPNNDPACPTGSCVAQQVVLGPSARLLMNGHFVTAAHHLTPIVCGRSGETGRCKVTGLGTVAGDHGTGIDAQDMDLAVTDVVVEGCDYAITSRKRIKAKNVGTSANDVGLWGVAGVTARRVILQDDSQDIRSDGDVIVRDVTVRTIVSGGTVRGGNAAVATIRASAVRMTRLTCIGPSDGITADGGVVLRDSTVTGHVADITSGERPVLVRTTCDHSVQLLSPTESWGVCRDD
jgi:hypothetical protein